MTKNFFLGVLTRCSVKFFVAEFTQYYLNEGVDRVVIMDDDSRDKNIYSKIQHLDRVGIIYEKDIIRRKLVQALYQTIRDQFEWLIYVDVDEFITTKRNRHRIIRDEIETNFQHVDCIKVPWIMMSSGGREKNPDSVLHANVWRWDHDKRHPHSVHKFRCRCDEIEVKCIFRPSEFKGISNHFPTMPCHDHPAVVDSVSKTVSPLNPFFGGLREACFEDGYLLCYHYRIISRENDEANLMNNMWYGNYSSHDLLRADHSEIFDNYMSS
jgi:hypothetical protein